MISDVLPFWRMHHLKRMRNEPETDATDPCRSSSQMGSVRYKGPRQNNTTGSLTPLHSSTPPPGFCPLERTPSTAPSLSVCSPSISASTLPFSASASTSKMESQETLINPTPLSLKFNKRSCTNVTIYQGTQPIYRVETSKDGTRTDLFSLLVEETDPKALITTIKRREFFPDVVKFRSRDVCVQINKWLHKEKLPHGLSGTTLDTSCGPLLWRYGQEELYRLALYTDKDSDVPVAHLDCSRTRIPMVLVIQPGYQDLVEEILTSALILEFKLKAFERIKKHDILYGPILGGLVTTK